MSAAALQRAQATVHPVVREAARGRLPEWTRAGPDRRRHMASVARVMDEWARALALESAERLRWRAAGFFHDALRDEDPETLRPLVDAALRDLPDRVLHGPAAAARLRREGVDDEALLQAVSFHTLGHPELGVLGRFLFAADYLEPERSYADAGTEALRRRMPEAPGEVLVTVTRARIIRTLDRSRPLHPLTLAFWNRLLDEAGRAPAGSGDLDEVDHGQAG